MLFRTLMYLLADSLRTKNIKILNAVFVHVHPSQISLKYLKSSSNVTPAKTKVKKRLKIFVSYNNYLLFLNQRIHHASKCQVGCMYVRLHTNGNARTAKLAVNVGKRKTTRCFTVFSATEVFTFTA